MFALIYYGRKNIIPTILKVTSPVYFSVHFSLGKYEWKLCVPIFILQNSSVQRMSYVFLGPFLFIFSSCNDNTFVMRCS